MGDSRELLHYWSELISYNDQEGDARTESVDGDGDNHDYLGNWTIHYSNK